MRISDWSSDVCSSDLGLGRCAGLGTIQINDTARCDCEQQHGTSDLGFLRHCHGETILGTTTVWNEKRGPASRARECRSAARSEEHTSELQSLMRISYAVFCLKTKEKITNERQGTMKTQKIAR